MSDISDMMYEQGYHDGYQLALSELNGKKFEKVIRCKDCKRWDRDSKIVFANKINGKWCYWCERVKTWEPDDWYCADGERK